MLHLDHLTDHWPDQDFTPIERAFLAYLLDAGRAVPADELLIEVWGYDPRARSDTIRTTVRRVRQKIEADPKRPTLLLHLRGQGYQLHLPTEQGPVAVSLPRRSTNLLAPDTPLVGRERDLAALEQHFDSGARLVTLRGPGGVGKTRLAAHYATGIAKDLPGGAWLCDLSPTDSADEALAIVASVLGVLRQGAGDMPIDEQIAATLAHLGPTLLVLDNFEQLEKSAAQRVASLLSAAPTLRVLVTSRTPLGIEAERVFDLDALDASAGLELLQARVAALRRGPWSQDDAASARGIVSLLQGIPLAIEMAAARARILPLRELYARLERSLGMLRNDQQDAPERHRTMQQAIAWSWDLLSAQERAVLTQFCAFRGGCPAAVADEIVHADGDVLSLLASLVDQSLLRTWPAVGGQRVGPWEPVREFAASHAGADLEHARRRHADWAAELAQRWKPTLWFGAAGKAAIGPEIDNLVAAHRWMLAHGDPRAVDLLEVLHPYYWITRQPDSLPDMVRATRERLGSDGPTHARLGFVLGSLLDRDHQLEAARVELERSMARALPGSRLAVKLGAALCTVLAELGDESGSVVAAQAVAEAEAQGYADLLPIALLRLGCVHVMVQPEAAEATFWRALELAEAQADTHVMVSVLNNLGICLSERGEFAAARTQFQRAHDLATELDNPASLHSIAGHRAFAELAAGDFEQAHRRYQALLAATERHGGGVGLGATHISAGVAALLADHARDAVRVLDQARLALEARAPNGVMHGICLTYLIVALATLDDLPTAERHDRGLSQIDPRSLTPATVAALQLARAHLMLLRARRTGAADPELIEQVRHRLAASEGLEDARLDRLLLQRALDRTR